MVILTVLSESLSIFDGFWPFNFLVSFITPMVAGVPKTSVTSALAAEAAGLVSSAIRCSPKVWIISKLISKDPVISRRNLNLDARAVPVKSGISGVEKLPNRQQSRR